MEIPSEVAERAEGVEFVIVWPSTITVTPESTNPDNCSWDLFHSLNGCAFDGEVSTTTVEGDAESGFTLTINEPPGDHVYVGGVAQGRIVAVGAEGEPLPFGGPLAERLGTVVGFAEASVLHVREPNLALNMYDDGDLELNGGGGAFPTWTPGGLITLGNLGEPAPDVEYDGDCTSRTAHAEQLALSEGYQLMTWDDTSLRIHNAAAEAWAEEHDVWACVESVTLEEFQECALELPPEANLDEVQLCIDTAMTAAQAVPTSDGAPISLVGLENALIMDLDGTANLDRLFMHPISSW